VLVLAQEEASQLNHNFIGTEHILLGILHEGEGVASKALDSLGIKLDAVRGRVEEAIGMSGATLSGSPPFTPRARRVLELSLKEALELGHSFIGTEHMLLGLVRDGDGVAAQVLVSLGADLGQIRTRVLEMVSGSHDDDADFSEVPGVGTLRQLRPQEDSLLLRLLWNSNMIREPQNDAEQTIWDALKERFDPSSEGGAATP
jgi:ATP-dependent Clp protease ATP-binding subunit ClpC